MVLINFVSKLGLRIERLSKKKSRGRKKTEQPNNCERLKNIGALAASIAFLFATPALAQFESEPGIGGSNEPNIPNIELEKRQGAEQRLEAFGTDLLGDGIDPHTGSLSFTTTDVSIPGNFSLPVMIERTRSQGLHYDRNTSVEFGDWQLNVPRIHVLTKSTNNWTGNRCTNTVSQSFPTHSVGGSGSLWTAGDYTNGINMIITGQGSKELLSPRADTTSIFPSGTTDVTIDGWRFTCGSASDGGQGFIGHSPDGAEYRFDRFYTVKADDLGSKNKGASMARNRNILAATLVTDVHGNTVNYTYDYLNRLTRIEASDSRRIDLTYTGTSKVIAKVTANPGTTDTREWNYGYASKTYPYQAGLSHSIPKSLTTVTQPDGLSWNYDLANMSASPGLGEFCPQIGLGLTVTHPHGMKGVFFLQETTHRPSLNRTENDAARCTIDEYLGTVGQVTYGTNRVLQLVRTLSVSRKTLSGPDISERRWDYTYESDNGSANSSANDPTNYTIVNEPGDRSMKYYHYWTADLLGGKLAKKEYFHGSTLLKTETYEYDQESPLGSSIMSRESYPWSGVAPTHITKTVVTQDGDTFTSERSYNSDQSSADYSYSRPVSERSYSNVNSESRGADVEYLHLTSKWILGLPETIFEVGTTGTRREKYAYTYTPRGQIQTQTRYGQLSASYTYHTTGAANGLVETYSDALMPPRVTQAPNWERGRPTQIIRPDKQQVYQTVDKNGWVTSQTDAKNQKTIYSHDNMGQLTLINPPGSWTNTVIDYDFPSAGGAVQTITKGSAKTTLTYDSMFQNTQEHQEETSTSWESYVNRSYDALGRQVFETFPSATDGETNGSQTKYDGLGRVYETLVNGTVVSSTEFLAGHKTRVEDAVGEFTETTKNGYGETVSILQPEGIKTEMIYNQFGQMTRVNQLSASGASGTSVNKSQFYDYDDQQRLCRYFTTEGRSTLYNYDAAGQNTAMLKGQGWTATCDSDLAASEDAQLQLTAYDALGRVETITYPNQDETDGFHYEYDANSNQTKAERLDSNGDLVVEQSYGFNTLNLPSYSLTKVHADASDGTPKRQFYAPSQYTLEGNLKLQRTPGGVWVDHDPDGFGRSRSVSYENDEDQTKVDLATNVSYHATGALASLTYGHGGAFSQSLDTRQRVKRTQSYGANGASILDLTLGYYDNNQIQTQTDGVNPLRTRGFIYDGAGRLTTASSADPLHGQIDYEYDALGNLRRKDFTGGQWDGRKVILTYNGVNRLNQSLDRNAANQYAYTGFRSAAHDDRGNITRLGGLNFDYDMTDQPVRIHGTSTKANGSDGSATDVTHSYDAHKRRVKSVEADGTVRYNIFDASGVLVQVWSPTTNTRTDYIPGPAGPLARIKSVGQSADEITYLHTDHQGTARAGTDEAGALLWEDFHTPFGDSLIAPAANDNQGDYTGHIRDTGSGLTYMQARYYDPVIGRFLSVDPVTFMDMGNPGMFNRYSYTFNDPVNMIDPDGENPLLAAFVAYKGAKTIVGFATGTIGGVVGSIPTQLATTGTISAKTTLVSGAKGGVVGAAQGLTGSDKVAVGTAFAAGFVDGGITHLVEGGNLVGALGQGITVGGIDATATAIGVKTPGKFADAAVIGFGIGAETAASKAPAVAAVLFDGAEVVGQQAIDSINDATRNVGERIGDYFDNPSGGNDDYGEY